MPASQFDILLNQLIDFDARLRSLESTNQIRQIILQDATSVNRIFLDGLTGAFKISEPTKDATIATGADLSFAYDPATGDLTIRGDAINTSAEIFSHVTSEHWFTDVATYEKISGTSFLLDGDNFNNQNLYFECNMLVEQSGRTAYTRLYNLTDSAVVAGSEITTTTVGTYDAGRGIYTTWDVVRSGALTFASGEKEYCVQVKQNVTGGAGDKAHSFQGRIVITQG